MQHWPVVYSPEFQSPTSCVGADWGAARFGPGPIDCSWLDTAAARHGGPPPDSPSTPPWGSDSKRQRRSGPHGSRGHLADSRRALRHDFQNWALRPNVNQPRRDLSQNSLTLQVRVSGVVAVRQYFGQSPMRPFIELAQAVVRVKSELCQNSQFAHFQQEAE
jgi:hypothetical protein